MSKKDGGPAFPSHGTMGEVAHEGMSLRDYLAAKAMQVLLQAQIDNKLIKGANIEVASYQIADAVLAERDK
jgi:hypothetical protein